MYFLQAKYELLNVMICDGCDVNLIKKGRLNFNLRGGGEYGNRGGFACENQ